MWCLVFATRNGAEFSFEFAYCVTLKICIQNQRYMLCERKRNNEATNDETTRFTNYEQKFWEFKLVYDFVLYQTLTYVLWIFSYWGFTISVKQSSRYVPRIYIRNLGEKTSDLSFIAIAEHEPKIRSKFY